MNNTQIELDSATPDFERASHVFSEIIGVPINEECVRKLWATCFVPQQRNISNKDITGRELVVQKHPAEISGLTQEGRCDGERNSNINHEPADNPIVPGIVGNRNEDANMVDKRQTNPTQASTQQHNSSYPVPIGIVDLFDEDDEDEMSLDQSQALFEEQGVNTEQRKNDSLTHGAEIVTMESEESGGMNDERQSDEGDPLTNTKDDSMSGDGVNEKDIMSNKGLPTRNPTQTNVEWREYNNSLSEKIMRDGGNAKRSSNTAPRPDTNIRTIEVCGNTE